MDALDAAEVCVRYGGIVANDRVSVTAGAGEVVGLIGPNGAGKTSFVDAVTGFTPSEGHIRLNGQRIDHLPAYRRARLGMRRTWQSAELSPDLTAEENVAIASTRLTPGRLVRDVFGRRQPHDPEPLIAMSDTGIGHLAGASVDELTAGQRMLVGVARALAASPAILILDEPAAGLDSVESREFGTLLRRLASSGMAVLLIDHDVDLVFGCCDRVYVMDFGSVIAQGPPAHVRADPGVVCAYLGSSEEPQE